MKSIYWLGLAGASALVLLLLCGKATLHQGFGREKGAVVLSDSAYLHQTYWAMS